MKSTQNVERFDEGIISSVDEKDIPDEAASWSFDVDGETEPGKLIGRFDDTLVTANSAAAIKSAKCNTFLTNSDKTQDLVYYNGYDGKIQTITDFYGSIGGITDQVTSISGKTVCMQVQNDAVHVGYGKTSSEPSKWLGRIQYGQFGGSAPSGIQCVNAELAPPQIFPVLYKTFSDGTYVYGIEFEGTKVFKITIATGVVAISTQDFVSTQGICKIDATYFYLFDKDGSYGTLYKMKISDQSIYETYPLDGFITTGGDLATCGGVCTDTVIVDIEKSASYLWFVSSSTIGFKVVGLSGTTDAAFLYNFQISSLVNGTAFHPADRSPTTAPSLSDGGFYTGTTGTPSYSIPPSPLIPAVETDRIIILVKVIAPIVDGSGSYSSVYTGAILVKEGNAAGTVLSDSGCLYFQLEGGTHNFANGCYLAGVGSNHIFLVTETGSGSLRLYIAIAGGASDWTSTARAWTPAFTGVNADASPVKSGGLTDITCCMISSIASYYTISTISSLGGLGAFYTFKVNASAVQSSIVAVAYAQTTIDAESFVSTVGTFSTSKRYFYTIAFSYDKFQLSPFPVYLVPATVVVQSTTDSIKVTLTLSNLSTISSRVDSAYIYRAESGNTSKYTPDSLYRYVDQIDLTKAINTISDAFWGQHSYQFIIDTGEYGTAYEQETGVAETLPSTTLNYELSTQYQGYQFVARAYNSLIPDASKMLFRSKLQCFDQFDWSNDFMVLPKIPTALASYNGKVFAFTDTEIYTINPQGLFIEDIYVGVGAFNEQSVLVTPYGMWIIDSNNIYNHDGRVPSPIGNAIKFAAASYAIGLKTTYLADSTSYIPFIGSFLKYNYILFGFSKVSYGVTIFYGYHVQQKRFDYWTISSTISGISTVSHYPGFINGKNGEIYFGGDSGLFSLASSATRKAFSWWSKKFDSIVTVYFSKIGKPLSRKKFYKTTLNSSGSAVTLTMSFDDGGFGSQSAQYFKRLVVKLVGNNDGTSVVQALSIFFRILPGETNANT